MPISFEVQWFNPMTWDGAPLLVVIAALWCIVMARANGTYWLGRAIANGTAHSRWKGLLESKHYRTAQRWIERWGAPAVTFCFLTIGIQTMVNLSAGITRMPQRKYLPAVAIGCVFWAIIYGTVGFIGFLAVARLWEFSPTLVLTLAAAIVLVLVYYLRGSRKRAPGHEASWC